MEQAVIDRFEGDLAVLLVGDERQPLDVPRSALPQGAGPGQWLQIAVESGRVVHAELDPEATEAAHQRIQDKLERLRRGEHLHKDQQS
jgi:hypothetical protein